MRTPNEKRCTVGGAASFQNNGHAEQNLHSTQQAESEAPPCPKLDHAKINRSVRVDYLSKSWARGYYRGPFVLRSLPNISTNHESGQYLVTPQFKWFDS